MTILLAFFVVFILFSVLRVPVAFSILMGGLAGYAASGVRTSGIPSALISALDSFPLLAIPAFIFAGELMAQGGISTALVRFINSIIGHFKGALGAVLIVASTIFGAITGSSVATVSAIGGIMVPEMNKAGYDKRYTCAILSASGFLGILIPPSVPGIAYALCAGLKVTDVWMCTLIPGILLAILYCFVNYIFYRKNPPKNQSNFKNSRHGRLKELRASTPKALVAFVMPLIIFGGVYGGVFTATEAGAVSVAYGLFAGWVLYPLIFRQKPQIGILSTARKSAVSALTIAMLICTANVVSRLITLGGVSVQLADTLMLVSPNKYVFLISINFLLLIVGMFLETNAGIFLFSPILIPLAKAYGVDPLHFGAILLLNLEIGLITPPFAANLFVACKITDTTIDEVLRPLALFFGCCIPVLLLTTFWPEFSTWLPGLLSR